MQARQNKQSCTALVHFVSIFDFGFFIVTLPTHSKKSSAALNHDLISYCFAKHS